MACKVNSCCCCCQLRTGALLIGKLIVMGGILQLMRALRALTPMEMAFYIYLGALSVALGAVLLHGIIKMKAKVVLWYVRIEIVAIVLSLIATAAIILGILNSQELEDALSQLKPEEGAQVESAAVVTLKVAVILVEAVATGLRVYFLVCVYSYYLELKNDPGATRIILSTPQPYVNVALPQGYVVGLQPQAVMPQQFSKLA